MKSNRGRFTACGVLITSSLLIGGAVCSDAAPQGNKAPLKAAQKTKSTNKSMQIATLLKKMFPDPVGAATLPPQVIVKSVTQDPVDPAHYVAVLGGTGPISPAAADAAVDKAQSAMGDAVTVVSVIPQAEPAATIAQTRTTLGSLFPVPVPPPVIPGTPTPSPKSYVRVAAVNPDPLNSERFVVVLASVGAISQAAADAAIAKAQDAVGSSVKVVSAIEIAPSAAPTKQITRTYTLHFLRGTLPSSVKDNKPSPDFTGTGTDTSATEMATFLHTVYKDTDVTAHENRLVMTGPLDQVNHIRQMLALTLDTPSPQVRADIYTIQVNTTPRNRDQAQDKIEEIAAGVQIVRDLILGSELGMGLYLGKTVTVPPLVSTDLMGVGFNPNPNRPLSISEMLIFMIYADRKQLINQLKLTDHSHQSPADTLADQLEDSLIRIRKKINDGATGVTLNSQSYDAKDAKLYLTHSRQLVKLIDRIEAKLQTARLQDKPVFGRLGKLYEQAGQAEDMIGVSEFIAAWKDTQGAFEEKPVAGNIDHFPDRLSQKGAAADLLLKEGMYALSTDLQDLYFESLLDWIREDVRGANAKGTGIDLVGSTQITVRDRTLGQTTGSAESYMKFTPIPHLTEQMLTDAQTLSNGTAATAAQKTQTIALDKGGAPVLDKAGKPIVLTEGETLAIDKDGNIVRGTDKDPVKLVNPIAGAASTVLGVLNPLQALAVKALFAEDVAPTYRKIAPGTDLSIRPFVLPDGGSARIQMNLTTSVDVEQPNPDQYAKRDIPFDLIRSHTVSTEATISAFDLETISSFGVQTTGPGDYAWRIPLLDEIPLLGELFHGPRRRETRRQDSIVIVNLTILPRSLDLVPYYGP